MKKLSIGREFENHCKDLLKSLGFQNTDLTRSTGDQGGDLIAFQGSIKYIFQCKCHKKKQGNKAVQEAIAAKTFYKAHRCGVISRSEFTKSAYDLARPNYCLLFTFGELEKAYSDNYKFEDIIKNYTIPSSTPVEHDYDLIGKYEELKSKLGHVPRNDDFDSTTRYFIRKQYGSLTKLIESIGDQQFTRRPNDDQIKKEYNRVRELIGKIPRLKDMRVNSDFSNNCFQSYPFTTLQRECGDHPNIERGITKRQLINAFNDLTKKLGKIPNLKDIDRDGYYRSSYYRTKWGNLDNFCEEMGISKAHFKGKRYNNEDLVLIYLLIKKAFEIKEDVNDFPLNHTVLENLKYKDKSFISPGTFSNHFGSWKEFITFLDKKGVYNAISDLTKTMRSLITSKDNYPNNFESVDKKD